MNICHLLRCVLIAYLAESRVLPNATRTIIAVSETPMLLSLPTAEALTWRARRGTAARAAPSTMRICISRQNMSSSRARRNCINWLLCSDNFRQEYVDSINCSLGNRLNLCAALAKKFYVRLIVCSLVRVHPKLGVKYVSCVHSSQNLRRSAQQLCCFHSSFSNVQEARSLFERLARRFHFIRLNDGCDGMEFVQLPADVYRKCQGALMRRRIPLKLAFQRVTLSVNLTLSSCRFLAPKCDPESYHCQNRLRPRCPLALCHAQGLDGPAAVGDRICHCTLPVIYRAIVCEGTG